MNGDTMGLSKGFIILAAVWATGSIALAGNGIRQVDVPAEAYA